MNYKKITFYLIWLGLISLGPITVLGVTPFASVVVNKVLLVNFFQRILGLTAFTLIFIQIILGSFMSKWIEKLGTWIFKFHITQEPIAYILIFLHPLMTVFVNYFTGRGLDPFYVFIDVCILCDGKFEWLYNFGRIGFWLITIAVIAALFRTSTPFLRLHWKKFHVLNYVAFYVIWFHSIKLGQDVGTPPFGYFHGPSIIIVSAIVIVKLSKFADSLAKHLKLRG